MTNQRDLAAESLACAESVPAARGEASAGRARSSDRLDGKRTFHNNKAMTKIVQTRITVLLLAALLFGVLLQSCAASPARRSGRPLILRSSRAHFAHKQEHDRLQQQLRHQLPAAELAQHRRHHHHMQARSTANMTSPTPQKDCIVCEHHKFVSFALHNINNTLDKPEMKNLSNRLNEYSLTRFPVPHPLHQQLYHIVQGGNLNNATESWEHANLTTIAKQVLHAIHHVTNASLTYQNEQFRGESFYKENAIGEIERLIIHDIRKYEQFLKLINSAEWVPMAVAVEPKVMNSMDTLFLGVREYVNLLRYQKEMTSRMCRGCSESTAAGGN